MTLISLSIICLFYLVLRCLWLLATPCWLCRQAVLELADKAVEWAGYSEGVAEWEEWEAAAFWTFVGMVELISPADFYAAPEMAGLQREWRTAARLCRPTWR